MRKSRPTTAPVKISLPLFICSELPPPVISITVAMSIITKVMTPATPIIILTTETTNSSWLKGIQPKAVQMPLLVRHELHSVSLSPA